MPTGNGGDASVQISKSVQAAPASASVQVSKSVQAAPASVSVSSSGSAGKGDIIAAVLGKFNKGVSVVAAAAPAPAPVSTRCRPGVTHRSCLGPHVQGYKGVASSPTNQHLHAITDGANILPFNLNLNSAVGIMHPSFLPVSVLDHNEAR